MLTTSWTLLLLCFTPFKQAQVSEGIRRIIENRQFEVAGQTIYCKKMLPEFYYASGFQPAWTSTDNIGALLEEIKQASKEGLTPTDYHYDYLVEQLKANDDVSPEMDVILTDAYLLYASHLMSGKINPEKLVAEWQVNPKEFDFIKSLSDALTHHSVTIALNTIKPQYKTYVRLREALNKYRQIQQLGGWKSILPGEAIKPGATDIRVTDVRNRLLLTGDLSIDRKDSMEYYDIALQEAVKVFQKRHGLMPDAVIGKNTIAVMNVPVEKRIEQVILNMERCRWLPLDLGQHYILVNIANFELEIVKNGKLEMEMNVVVGKPFRKTPVFSKRMLYMTFNPYWTVPPTILANDVLPAIKKNTGYLSNQNMKVISGNNEVDPASIDWSSITPGNFPYQIRQDPGTNNALGLVKFIFPNPYNVYMHDTNHRELFSRTDRALSSGCIRLSRPLDLANYLLSNEKGEWSREKIDRIIARESNHTVVLKNEIYVHLLYWTSFVGDDGRINFREDVYERDEILWKAMLQAPPSID